MLAGFFSDVAADICVFVANWNDMVAIFLLNIVIRVVLDWFCWFPEGGMNIVIIQPSSKHKDQKQN